MNEPANDQELHEHLKHAVETISKGGIILYPTDTVWGLGCDATNPEAVLRLNALKKRKDNTPMICLINGERMLHYLFKDIPEVAWQILDLSDKPTTLILDNPRNVAENLMGADQSLGVRIVREPFCYKLIDRMKKPLVSTSANLSGQPAPKSFSEISPEILNGVDYVVNLQTEKTGIKPSTIIKLTRDAQVKIIRK